MTLIDKEQIARVKDMGIDFGVSPGWSEELWACSLEVNLPFFRDPHTDRTFVGSSSRVSSAEGFPDEPVGGISYLQSLIAPSGLWESAICRREELGATKSLHTFMTRRS